jgi:hypothetical protein
MASKIYLLDDGVAYYNNAKVNNTKILRLYILILRLRFGVNIVTFNDVALLPIVFGIYAIMPDRIKIDRSRRNRSFIKNKIEVHYEINKKLLPEKKVLFLDTNPADYTIYNIDVVFVAKLVSTLAVKYNLEVIVKPHPSGMKSNMVGSGFDQILKQGDILNNIELFKYQVVIGYFSTGLMIIKKIYPTTRVMCIATSQNLRLNENLLDIFLEIGIEIIEIK